MLTMKRTFTADDKAKTGYFSIELDGVVLTSSLMTFTQIESKSRSSLSSYHVAFIVNSMALCEMLPK